MFWFSHLGESLFWQWFHQNNQGQVYQVQASEALGDISGAYIEADNDVVVLCGAKWIEIPIGCGTRDNLIEMLAPLATWGRQFVSVPTSGSIYDKYRVIASEDNTTVSIENSKIIKVSLNRGEIHEFDTSEPIFVLASKLAVAPLNSIVNVLSSFVASQYLHQI